MEKWLARLWHNNQEFKKQSYAIIDESEKPEDSNKQEETKEPFNFSFDGGSIKTFLNEFNELCGQTEIITDNIKLVCDFVKNKPIGLMSILNPQQRNDKMELNFNKSHELHGKCLVHDQELIFKNGKLTDVNFHKQK